METAEENIIAREHSPARPRLLSLDILRGTYILLAIWQHFAGILTERNLPVDDAIYFLYRYLTPSGDQLFLALAAFNLASRRPAQFASHYQAKLLVFNLLFWFFLIENIIVSNDLGDGLSWGPMLTWMVLLALVATAYRFLGLIGIVALFVLQLGLFVLPMEHWNNQLEQHVREVLSLPYFVYESRLDLFLGSACVGFFIGYLYHHSTAPRRLLIGFVLGALCFLPFLLWGELPELDRAHIWASEYTVTRTTIGLISIWGVILMLICGLLQLELWGAVRRLPLISWCGEHSLLIFGIHRILFIRMILPLALHVALLSGVVLVNSFPLLVVYSGIVLAISWLILKTRLFAVLAR